MRTPLLTLVALGCVETEGLEPFGREVDHRQVASFEALPGIGAAPLSVTVLARTAWAIPVDGAAVSVTVDDAPVDVAFDGAGYGAVVLSEVGSYEVAAPSGPPVEAHVLSRGWGGGGLMGLGTSPGAASLSAAATDGALVAEGGRLWWVDPSGAAHVVLALPDARVIAGLITEHVDRDGVRDALVWDDTSVVVLRGRPGGGMTYGAVFEADGASPTAVTAADFDVDGSVDVGIGWTDRGGWFEVWDHDGAWSFTSQGAIALDGTPLTATSGDERGLGVPQITLLLDSGRWQRLTRLSSGLGSAGSQLADVTFVAGTTFESGRDFNGDGTDELFAFAPRVDGAERDIRIFDLDGDRARFTRLTPIGAYATRADTQGDGPIELFLLHEDRELFVVGNVAGQNTQRRAAVLDDAGPLAATDHTGDGIADLHVAGADTWRWWTGDLQTSTDARWWVPADPVLVERPIDAVPGVVTTASLSGLAVVAFEVAGINLDLVVYGVTPGLPPAIALRDRVRVGASTAVPLDVASCGDLVVAVLDTGTVSVRFTAGVGTVLQTRLGFGDRVACGDLGGPSAVLLDQGDLVEVGPFLGEFSRRPVPGAVDLAVLARPVVTDVVVTCDTPGCEAEGWDFDQTGAEVLVAVDAGGAVVDEVVSLPGSGHPRAGDVDGDGIDDLVVAGDAGVFVYRSTGAGFGVPRSGHFGRPVVGPVLPIDVTGDARAEFVFLDDQGNLVVVSGR